MPASSSKGKITSTYESSEVPSILKKSDPTPYTTGSRWANSSVLKPKTDYSTPSTSGKTEYEPAASVVGSFYEENHLPSLASHEGSTRRPNKYVSKYGSSATKSGGSKTEKIVSKSSKSSPNLNYDSQKWTPSTYGHTG